MDATCKMHVQNPLEEVDLSDGTVKLPTYISTKVDNAMKRQMVKLLMEFRDFLAWDYNEVTGLSRDMV